MPQGADYRIAASRDTTSIYYRIVQIYRNRGVPPPSNIMRQVSRVQNEGAGYFDIIRDHAVRAGSQIGGGGGGGGGTPSTPTPSTPPTPSIPAIDYRSAASSLYPWLTPALVDVFAQAWAEFGSAEIAMSKVRQSPTYTQLFPGIKRDDGSLRMTEQEYFQRINDYSLTLRRYGLPPDQFRSRFTDLITGEVDAREFENRLDILYTQVLSRGPEIRREMAALGFAPDISDAAILGSALDPDTPITVMERRIRMSQIGGTARRFGLRDELADAELTRLTDFGLDENAAVKFFSTAAEQLPVLGRLIERHNDPDDDFDLSELSDALVFADPSQRNRLQRLFGAEASLFTGGALFREDRSGGLIGLRPR